MEKSLEEDSSLIDKNGTGASKCSSVLINAEQELCARNGKAASALLEQSRSMNPNDSNVLNNLALAAVFEKNYQKAQDILRQILVADPFNVTARANQCYLQRLENKG